MVLEVVKGSGNIPKGSVQLTREEAINHQKEIVKNWPNYKEVFFLRFGKYIASITTCLTAAACVNIYYPLLKFGIGTITTVIPGVLFPPVLMYYKVEKDLINDILVMKTDCPVCVQLKFTAMQIYAGMFFPGILGVLNAHWGINIPYHKDNGADYWKKVFKVAVEKKITFQCALITHLALTLALPFFQNKEITFISEKLKENFVEDTSEELTSFLN